MNPDLSPSRMPELACLPALVQLAQNISSLVNYSEDVLKNKYFHSFEAANFHKRGIKPSIDAMMKLMSEMHVAHVLEKSLGVNLDRNRLQGNVSSHFELALHPNTPGAYVFRKELHNRAKTPTAEIDILALLKESNVPFVIEVETGKSTKNARTRSNEAIAQKRIDLLRSVFSKAYQFGYILVVDKSQLPFENSPNKMDFIKRGGIITSFPVPREQFIQFVARVRKDVYSK